jgi:hypothetical protein
MILPFDDGDALVEERVPRQRVKCPVCWGSGEDPSASITGFKMCCRVCRGNGYFSVLFLFY